jgi:hypothetical protein
VVKVNETLTIPINVRTGPGTNYPVVGQFLPGQKAFVTGRNVDNSWWQVKLALANQPGMFGWVASQLVTLSDDNEAIPIAEAPPPPSPVPTSTPMPTSLSAADILRQIVAAEAGLHTGQFEASIDNGDGTGSSARVRFDLGHTTGVPRFHITSTYTGTKGAQTVERITIGDQSWERQPGGRWAARPAHEGVVDQVVVFLPRAESIVDAEITSKSGMNVLRWYDAGRDVEVTLVVDPVTGVPRELRQVVGANGMILTVTYSGWNTALEITPPEGS